MIVKERCIVMDIDGTLCPIRKPEQSYEDLPAMEEVVERVREYKRSGFHIILCSSRNMNTYDGNVGMIGAKTAKILLAWLERHGIPYDELHLGKPWAGRGGFYVDDKAIRPDEFLSLSYEEVLHRIGSAGDQ